MGLEVKPVNGRRGAEHGSGLGHSRWLVERAFAGLHWFHRLRIRWEIRDAIHEAFPCAGGDWPLWADESLRLKRPRRHNIRPLHLVIHVPPGCCDSATSRSQSGTWIERRVELLRGQEDSGRRRLGTHQEPQQRRALPVGGDPWHENTYRCHFGLFQGGRATPTLDV